MYGNLRNLRCCITSKRDKPQHIMYGNAANVKSQARNSV